MASQSSTCGYCGKAIGLHVFFGTDGKVYCSTEHARLGPKEKP